MSRITHKQAVELFAKTREHAGKCTCHDCSKLAEFLAESNGVCRSDGRITADMSDPNDNWSEVLPSVDACQEWAACMTNSWAKCCVWPVEGGFRVNDGIDPVSGDWINPVDLPSGAYVIPYAF